MNDRDRLRAACAKAVAELLAERHAAGHWVGELSASPLANAVACVALRLIDRAAGTERHANAVARGMSWLLAKQNADGGWGDTDRSLSNVSTTMLAYSALRLEGIEDDAATRAWAFVEARGGVEGIKRRYGKDQTFSVPILTCAALCGVVPWSVVPRLPFELAALPPRFYAAVRLPVVSYALPALIAIGQVRHHHGKPWNPVTRGLRHAARAITLRRLEGLQPSNGGFLEATPLTAFVTMSLAGLGLPSHPVAEKGVAFLAASQRPDGSWPIDTNLATWVTTLAINALGEDLPPDAKPPLLEWLLGQQYQDVHPFTQAAPGGWAWTDLPGGVPDADDTSGALLALRNLAGPNPPAEVRAAAVRGLRWLKGLRNRDGGWPTFCRGWGTLPFDRSSLDITAHALAAARAWDEPDDPAARTFLAKGQAADGSWSPLWFGNQHHEPEENALYGTAKALSYLAERRAPGDASALARGVRFLLSQQHPDGGWGGTLPEHASIEETALALAALLDAAPAESAAISLSVAWLVERVEDGRWRHAAPIGFYFAKLWYYERLYPMVWTVAALRKACR